ncbi:DUF2577 domain-containing protein [Paenibacillus sp. Leaf72]|uniref:DUF2577 domain-containing protein n=1 Tax=Paenibacillus sp. Leaf72 TaxID=1736234 RepID=UPI0006F3A9BB|nr:DUF2577 domain-containing protein [Paenibacillus sp. Leaf72]KQN96245.1 hypothetical protein ASF12_25870 [Paenibacillus sp. Leaf72]
MMALLDAIKKAGAAAHASGNPVAVLIGRVTGTNPLEVNVDQRFTLSEDFLIIPESMTQLETGLMLTYEAGTDEAEGTSTNQGVIETAAAGSGSMLRIRRALDIDDKVLLLRVQGGQQFVVLDRVSA